jgi:NAD-dependent deacetylase
MHSNTHIPSGLIHALRSARAVTVLTGAGISAESGLPTFRDAADGIWSQFRPQDLATAAGFRANPTLVWSWYAELKARADAAQPGPGHNALAQLARYVPRLTLLTQNIDGLHQRAGSTDVIELHGTLARTRCFDEDGVVEHEAPSGNGPPHCPRCGGFLRPDIVWFEELLPVERLRMAQAAAENCDLFLAIGTSLVVEPAASLPYRALSHGAAVAILNLDVTPRDTPPLYLLHGQAGVLLPALLRAAWPDEAPERPVAEPSTPSYYSADDPAERRQPTHD